MGVGTKESTDTSTALLPPWKPGQSGNPKGIAKGTVQHRTVLKYFLDANLQLPEDITVDGFTLAVKGRTLRTEEILALVQIKKAMEGDTRAYSEILDRLEGKANIKADLNITTKVIPDMKILKENYKLLGELFDE